MAAKGGNLAKTSGGLCRDSPRGLSRCEGTSTAQPRASRLSADPLQPTRAELGLVLQDAEGLMHRLDTLNLTQEAAHVSMAVDMLKWAAWWRPSQDAQPAPDGEE